MSGKQTLIAFIGAALIIANLVTNRGAKTGGAGIAQTLFNSNASTATLASAHTELLGIVAEIGVLIFLVIVAGTSDNVANIAMVFVIGLAAVWGLTKYSSGPAPAVGGVASGVQAAA